MLVFRVAFFADLTVTVVRPAAEASDAPIRNMSATRGTRFASRILISSSFPQCGDATEMTAAPDGTLVLSRPASGGSSMLVRNLEAGDVVLRDGMRIAV